MGFIKENWDENHILARDRKFFDWMYVDRDGCNFIIAVDGDGNMLGMEGVIKYNSSEHPDLAGTMWKVKKSGNPQLGMEIGKKMYEVYQARCDVAPGVNRRAMKINQMLGYLSAPLNHYYIPGKRPEYQLAVIKKSYERRKDLTDKKFVFLNEPEDVAAVIDDEWQRGKAPYKDAPYILHRYMRHPVYQYEMIGIQDAAGRIRSIIVGREVSCRGALAYKIVDYIGHYEDLMNCSACFYELLDNRQYEYMDLYCYGISDSILESAGFLKRISDEVVIPNYFSPFERRNVDIYFVSSISEGLNVFRGDADQDRPG